MLHSDNIQFGTTYYVLWPSCRLLCRYNPAFAKYFSAPGYIKEKRVSFPVFQEDRKGVFANVLRIGKKFFVLHNLLLYLVCTDKVTAIK